MNSSLLWIWQQPDWPNFTWDDRLTGPLLGEIHRLEGRLLGNVQGMASRDGLESEMNALLQIEQILLKAKFWQRHAQTILNERQLKVINRLLDAGPDGFEGGLNARKYVGLTQVSKATATRDLNTLVERGCLRKRDGGGRSTSYEICWMP